MFIRQQWFLLFTHKKTQKPFNAIISISAVKTANKYFLAFYSFHYVNYFVSTFLLMEVKTSNRLFIFLYSSFYFIFFTTICLLLWLSLLSLIQMIYQLQVFLARINLHIPTVLSFITKKIYNSAIIIAEKCDFMWEIIFTMNNGTIKIQKINSHHIKNYRTKACFVLAFMISL